MARLSICPAGTIRASPRLISCRTPSTAASALPLIAMKISSRERECGTGSALVRARPARRGQAALKAARAFYRSFENRLGGGRGASLRAPLTDLVERDGATDELERVLRPF